MDEDPLAAFGLATVPVGIAVVALFFIVLARSHATYWAGRGVTRLCEPGDPGQLVFGALGEQPGVAQEVHPLVEVRHGGDASARRRAA